MIPSQKSCEHTAIVSLILGMIGIMMGCAGYGLAFGVVGLLGAYTAWKRAARETES